MGEKSFMNKIKNNEIVKRIVYIICAAIALIVVFFFFSLVDSAPDNSSLKKCQKIHEIYMNEKSEQKIFASKAAQKNSLNIKNSHIKKLYEFGLYNGTHDKKWNEEWIIDEEFIRTYVENYSSKEFLEIYDTYVTGYTKDPYYWGNDINFYDELLLKKISETTSLVFSMTDLFDIVGCHPLTDAVIKKNNSVSDVKGDFNVGSDNSVVSRSSTITKDTYEYDGYMVTHTYGNVYHEGTYGWYNGVFKDVKPYFEYVDYYELYMDDQRIKSTDSMKEMACKWIVAGDKKYFERIITGINTYNNFSEPISVLTDSVYDVDKQYIIEK